MMELIFLRQYFRFCQSLNQQAFCFGWYPAHSWENRGQTTINAPVYIEGLTPIFSYANLGNGHVVVYGPEGRALYDVSSSRINVVEWNQAPNGTYFPKKGSDTKVFEGNVPQSVLDSLGLK